jgi:hypothetical protein
MRKPPAASSPSSRRTERKYRLDLPGAGRGTEEHENAFRNDDPEGYIGTGAVVLGDVNWLGVLSAGAFGAVTALLLAQAGLPEAEEKPEKKME